MLLDHGGNIKNLCDTHGIPRNKIIDFASNISPLGILPRIKNIVTREINFINQYPDPECESARSNIARYLGVAPDNVLVSNGSNELIHLIPRALGSRCALIYRPTFSEYELSLKLSGARCRILVAKEEDDFCIDVQRIINFVSKVDLVILCNPNNPTGYLISKQDLLSLSDECLKRKTYLVIDEAFMEFVEDESKFSLVRKAQDNRYIIVLRSLTKFFSLPGLRIGYLVADRDIIKRINLFQPTWSVNWLAQGIVTSAFFDPDFIRETKEYIIKERHFLFARLKAIDQLRPYYPSANFIFCKILDRKINAKTLSSRLARSGILIRDCASFKGLSESFFRIAVRNRKDNLYLIKRLEEIFG